MDPQQKTSDVTGASPAKKGRPWLKKLIDEYEEWMGKTTPLQRIDQGIWTNYQLIKGGDHPAIDAVRVRAEINRLLDERLRLTS